MFDWGLKICTTHNVNFCSCPAILSHISKAFLPKKYRTFNFGSKERQHFLELSNKTQACRIFYTGSKANKDLFTSQGR